MNLDTWIEGKPASDYSTSGSLDTWQEGRPVILSNINDEIQVSSIHSQIAYTSATPYIAISNIFTQVVYSDIPPGHIDISNIHSQIAYTNEMPRIDISHIFTQVAYTKGSVSPTAEFIAASPSVPVVMAILQTTAGIIRRATTFYVNTDGDAFLPGLISPTISQELRDIFSGVEETGDLTLQIELGEDLADYADNYDLRGSTLKIYYYDPDTGENINENIEFYGKIDSYERDDCFIWFKCRRGDDISFDKLLPPDLVTAERFHSSALDIGAPINMPFGLCRDIPCPNIRNDYDNDDYWYLISYSGIEDIIEIRRDGWIVSPAEYEVTHGLFFDYIKFTVEQKSFSGTMHKITATVQGFKPRYKIDMIVNGNLYFMSISEDPAAHHVVDVLKMMLTHENSINDEMGVDEENFEAAKTALGDAGTLWKVDINIGGVQKRAGDWLNDILAYMPIHLYRGHTGKWCLSVDTISTGISFNAGQNDGYYNNCIVGTRSIDSASSTLKKVKMQYNFSESTLDKYGKETKAPYNYEIEANTGSTKGTEKTISLVAVNDTATAKKMLSRIINTAKYSYRWVPLECGPELKTAICGDSVRLFSSYPDTYRDYLIHSFSKNYLTGKFEFKCRSYDDRIFDDIFIADPVEPAELTTAVSGPEAIPIKYRHRDGTEHAAELTPTEIGGYDFGGQLNGRILTGNYILHRLRATRRFVLPINLTGSHLYAGVAATSSTTFTLKQHRAIQDDVVTIGTATFPAGGTRATFTVTALTRLLPGDTFTLEGPATPDATLSDFGWSFVGVKESEWTV